MAKRSSGSTIPREFRTFGVIGRGETTGPRDLGEGSAFRTRGFDDRQFPVVTESKSARVPRDGPCGRTTRGIAVPLWLGVALRVVGVLRMTVERLGRWREMLDLEGILALGRETRERVRPTRQRLVRLGLRVTRGFDMLRETLGRDRGARDREMPLRRTERLGLDRRAVLRARLLETFAVRPELRDALRRAPAPTASEVGTTAMLSATTAARTVFRISVGFMASLLRLAPMPPC